MESVLEEKSHEYSPLQGQNVIVNGELSKKNVDVVDAVSLKPPKNCGTKTIAELNGVTIRAPSDTDSDQRESSLTLGPTVQPRSDPLTTDMSLAEERDRIESSPRAGPVDTSQKTANLTYVGYESERQMEAIMALITKDLSEPYSIYTYRYFIHNWPKLCFLAMDGQKCVGAVVCKLDVHKNMIRRGYIAMLAVEKEYRRHKIGTNLVVQAIKAMIKDSCDEVVLETEVTNMAALRLYENLGFVRDKRLFRYYLNGVDALRLKLWLR